MENVWWLGDEGGGRGTKRTTPVSALSRVSRANIVIDRSYIFTRRNLFSQHEDFLEQVYLAFDNAYIEVKPISARWVARNYTNLYLTYTDIITYISAAFE